MERKPRKRIEDMIEELRSWLPNYNHGPNDYPILLFRILASLPGGDELEDMGYETFNLGWHEADQLARTLDAIQDKYDVEDLVHGLIHEEEEDVDEARRHSVDLRENRLTIAHTIYSAHLSQDTPEEELRAIAEAYGEAIRRRLSAEFPGAVVRVRVLHGVEGVGTGTEIYGDVDRATKDNISHVIDSVEIPWDEASRSPHPHETTRPAQVHSALRDRGPAREAPRRRPAPKARAKKALAKKKTQRRRRS